MGVLCVGTGRRRIDAGRVIPISRHCWSRHRNSTGSLRRARPGFSASIQRDGQGAVFDFFAPASLGGALLQQIQFLPPGGIGMLSGRSSGINQPVESQPYWILTCTDNGRELGRVAVPNSDQAGGAFCRISACPGRLCHTISRLDRARVQRPGGADGPDFACAASAGSSAVIAAGIFPSSGKWARVRERRMIDLGRSPYGWREEY